MRYLILQPHTCSKKGMTLIEVLVSLVIISIMTASVYGTIYTSRQVQKANEQKSKQYQLIRGFLSMLEDDLSMSYLSLGEDTSAPEKRTFFRANYDGAGLNLVFSTFSHIRSSRKNHEADNAIVQYAIIDDPEMPSRYAIKRRETHRLEQKYFEEIPGESWLILPRVDSLRMEFYDKTRDEWLEEWDTTTIDGQINRLPNQIKIHLVVEDGRENLIHFTTFVQPKLIDSINLTPSGNSSSSSSSTSSSTSGSSSTGRTTTGSTTSSTRVTR
ncbi:MAG: prepilin-type N-terminal cleavage/methylation domain-containing protein [Deltaproteobacteria bacterium]|nr:prepilin-type N-terminal cleavage/methylation domain-containing protein [Deltaproteobacteria bacterium]